MLGKWGIYTLEEELGRGGMAVVYAASKIRDGDFKREVCLKQILPSLSEDPEFEKMFVQEAGVAASLRHPNIVAVTDFDRVEGQLFLEMELVDGIDLERLLAEVQRLGVTLPLGFARYATRCLLAALAHAHGRVVDGDPAPVIHRDVSPANVMVSTVGEVKLTDFGIAKVRGSRVVTVTGDVKGKLSYLSPEQARGRDLDLRTDLFSAGLVLHELLTGRRFNRGETHSEEMSRAMNPDQPGLPWLSDEWNRLLEGLLAREPEDRFAGADEALAALDRIPIDEPYDREDAGRLVERVRRLGVDRDELQPTGAGSADRAPASPTPLAVARTGAGQPRKGGTAWLKVALAVAVAAVLFLLAREMTDRSSGPEPVGEPGSPAVDAPGDDVAPAAVAVRPVAVADAGAEPAGGAADAGAGEDASRARAAVKGPGLGRLEVNCRPWARVSVDGRDVGTTPIRDLEVRAGRRRVTLRNDELGYSRTFTVNVPKGGVGKLSEDISPTGPAAGPNSGE